MAEKAKSSSLFLNQTEPKPFAGVKKPLFDRLIDNELEVETEHPKKVILNKNQVIESIVKEVDILLNTRLSATAKIYAKYKDMEYGMGLPWMYGIPDFNSIDAANKTSWPKIAKIFEKAISYFEPRLKMVKVTIDNFDGKSQSLNISIRGQVNLENYQQPVFFGIEVKDAQK